ncbi:HTTM domain-containing protein [Nemorincola caseinilytica]|uniref:HTTM domain-containing protein n=1 Tax=Nemorincola caseinilytica TaxID=2054315 RepID=A0ABP8N5Y3_9BACT
MSRTTSISIKTYLEQPLYSAALAVFRLAFGIMLFGGVIRFWLRGWIEELYIRPHFYFHYYGFEWIKPLGNGAYLLFAVCAISALFFAVGLFYRLSATVLFLSFTWIELLDKTNYLNHYYFVSLALFLMIWLPAQANLSLDAWQRPTLYKRYLPRWTIGSIRLMLGIVYIYAGLAKLNSDWLVQAMPLRLWLPAKNDLPLVGPLLNKEWVAYAFSWFGAVYDLTVPFFLLNRSTRPFAFATVIVFHVATSILFPIGMFPYIMILSTLIFFDSRDIDTIVKKCEHLFTKLPAATGSDMFTFAPPWRRVVPALFAMFFVIQLLLPWRYLLLPGELFWTEEGYRFSWRVMLMEKTGYAQFVVRDGATGRQVGVNNTDFLTANQEKMMATQPDLLLQYAHMLRDHYRQQGMQDPKVYATVYVTLNGRRSRLLTDTSVDLAAEKDGFFHKKWITDQQYKIYGL